MGTGIHNAKVEGIKEGGELPRLCNFIAESAIRFLSKLSCRWRRSYRAAHQPAAPFIEEDDFPAAPPVTTTLILSVAYEPAREQAVQELLAQLRSVATVTVM